MKSRYWIAIIILMFGIWISIHSKSKLPNEQVNDMGYDLPNVIAPALRGYPLMLFSKIARIPLIGDLIMAILKKQNRMSEIKDFAFFHKTIPRYLPFELISSKRLIEFNKYSKAKDYNSLLSIDKSEERMKILANKEINIKNSKGLLTVESIHNAYLTKKITPLEFIKDMLLKVEKLSHLNLFISLNKDDILKQAKESSERWLNNKALSILDGVPVGVKDEFDVKGYGTTKGTLFYNKIANEDSLLVSRLRKQGCIIFGKLNMHEIGSHPNGINTNFGITYSPYSNVNRRDSGGSSSASGASIASGLFPITVGADGGGSIRVPASLNGVVGLSCTYQRIPFLHGSSTLHTGILSSTIRDQIIGYKAISGGLLNHPLTTPDIPNSDPPFHLNEFDNNNLHNIKLGIYWDWFNDSDEAIVNECNKVLNILSDKYNAKLVNFTFPYLSYVTRSHSISIVTEFLTGQEKYYRDNEKYLPDTEMLLTFAQYLTASDFLYAQRIRSWCIHKLNELFETFDVIITPATGITSPKIFDDCNHCGESNLELTSKVMRYVAFSNFAGIPALVVPVGYTTIDGDTLPISIQLMAKHWNEHLLFRIGRIIEDYIFKRELAPDKNRVEFNL